MNKKQLVKIFLIRAILLFLGWTLLFHYYLVPHTQVNEWLTRSSVYGTHTGLELLGYESNIEFIEGSTNGAGLILINSEPSVLIANPCNGLELFALFAGFLIVFPGPWKPKLFYNAIGVLMLFLLNIVRQTALALNYYHFRFSFDFNHKYTYAIFVYLCVFLLWRYWMNKYSALAPANQ